MRGTQTLNRTLETVAWGLFFLWWGAVELFSKLAGGGVIGNNEVFAMGIGVIMLGLNLVRWLSGIAISGLSLTVGILAFLWGALRLAGVLLPLPFEVPVFAVLLIVLGVIVLARGVVRGANENVMPGRPA